jgi:CBS domain-containing protein
MSSVHCRRHARRAAPWPRQTRTDCATSGGHARRAPHRQGHAARHAACFSRLQEAFIMRTIEKLMTRSVQLCHAYETLDRAAQKMWDGDIGAVPVLDDEQRLSGMITDRDICMATYTQARPPREIIIGEVMSSHPVSCHASDSVAAVAALMKQHQLRRLPVIDSDRQVLGIVTINDLVGADGLSEHELVATLGAIGHPRDQRALPVVA